MFSRRHVRGARRRFMPLQFEQLEDRSLLAAIITINSAGDTNLRDSVLTLREAILVSNRTLAPGSLSAAEQGQVSGTPDAISTDTIAFNLPTSGGGHYYYRNNNGPGVSLANVELTTAATDTAIADIDPHWPHSWFSIRATEQMPIIIEGVVISTH